MYWTKNNIFKVDMMLGAYMEDLNLQPEDLETALGQVKPSIRSAALQVILLLQINTSNIRYMLMDFII